MNTTLLNKAFGGNALEWEGGAARQRLCCQEGIRLSFASC
jgi:hypothetical protein